MYCYGLVRTREIEHIESIPDGIEGRLRWIVYEDISA